MNTVYTNYVYLKNVFKYLYLFTHRKLTARNVSKIKQVSH